MAVEALPGFPCFLRCSVSCLLVTIPAAHAADDARDGEKEPEEAGELCQSGVEDVLNDEVEH